MTYLREEWMRTEEDEEDVRPVSDYKKNRGHTINMQMCVDDLV